MGRCPYYRGARPEMARFLPAAYSKVLEIGCGEGDFAENLTHPCEYWGVEPFRAAAEIATRKLDRVLAGTYDEVCDELPADYFDLVICNDVMEHMTDHEAFLRGVKLKMKAGACLVGSIPNVRYFHNLMRLLREKDWKYEDEGVLDRTHLRFFTERSLRRTLAETGFAIEEFGGINGLTIRPTSAKKVTRKALIRLLGRDTRFMQFGFRVRYGGGDAAPSP